jgi:hypothetical protein
MYCLAKRNRLVLAVGLVLSCGTVLADFPAELELSSLNGTNGVIFNGVNSADLTGDTVSSAGDLNGDTIDDLVIGAPFADPNGLFSGICYVVFGRNQAFSSPFNLATLNGSNGFVINGEAVFDGACESVAAAGDVNGDDIDDLVIGAPDASPDEDFAGIVYVVFGTNSGFPNPLELSAINGTNGFEMHGIAENDAAGTSVAGAVDINHDGIDDVVIGAPFSNSGAGTAYVVFGSDSGLPSPLDLSSLDGSNGFVINGIAAGDSLGSRVGRAGDINDDGIDDLVIGAPLAEGDDAGAAYVVFGSDEAWGAAFNLASLDGTNGFSVTGIVTGDGLDQSIGAAGDVNGDTVDDLMFGTPAADPNGASSGTTFIVFGGQAWSAEFDLAGLNGTNGVALHGVAAGDESGTSVAGVGDINNDTIDDVVLGAPQADPNPSAAGQAYAVFGSASAWPASINLSTLDGSDGFAMNGTAEDDNAGRSVRAAGDVNGDGSADFLVGAPGDPFGSSVGRAYLVFGLTDAEGDLIFSNGFE